MRADSDPRQEGPAVQRGSVACAVSPTRNPPLTAMGFEQRSDAWPFGPDAGHLDGTSHFRHSGCGSRPSPAVPAVTLVFSNWVVSELNNRQLLIEALLCTQRYMGDTWERIRLLGQQAAPCVEAGSALRVVPTARPAGDQSLITLGDGAGPLLLRVTVGSQCRLQGLLTGHGGAERGPSIG
ncbi:hypothetical protein TREES_T100016708 [Tupaia chinensis]|uniref:Uncharacterized protein n=1 Tax=Tupaia chinensis TaxID=246437 RepID=L9LAC6_TUPCH|nr:hypothetical protein TREES_T100016708 [Tupaia chinensis]